MGRVDLLQQKIGIIGGGQLGKMMILEAKKMGFYVVIVDPSPQCPAHSIADEHIVGDFDEEAAIRKLAKKTDIITYEFEHIGVQVLEKLEQEGVRIYPTVKSLKVIQNKLTQKEVLQAGRIPVPEFMSVEREEDIEKAGEVFGYPMILKTCTGGYDGKGNALVRDCHQVREAYTVLGAGRLPLMVEKFVPFTKEISVLACRGIDGQTVTYPVGENLHAENILIETKVPADLSEESADQAMKLANQVMEVFEGVGMFCIEMFVTADQQIWVNEVAPRPHNSGHYSIEGCMTSQFEQHIRAISGLPLGATDLLGPTVMRNLLGESGYRGQTQVEGLEEALQIKGVRVHIYGKTVTAPKRKMGHLTVVASTLDEAVQNARAAGERLKMKGKDREE